MRALKGDEMDNLIRDVKEIKEAIATLSSSVVELEGRIRCLENYIKEEEEAELAIKTKKEWWDIESEGN